MSEHDPSYTMHEYPPITTDGAFEDELPPAEAKLDDQEFYSQLSELMRAAARSRIGHALLAGLVAGAAFFGIREAVGSDEAQAEVGHTYTVTGTGGDGVWLHEHAQLQNDILIKVLPEGTSIQTDCYVLSDPVGEKGNPVWLHGSAVVDGQRYTGFVTDSFSSSTWSHENTLKDQGLPICGEEVPQQETQDSPDQGSGENLQPAESLPAFASYDRQAAADWAKAHAMDTPPNAGSCTWFVSNAMWQGGLAETAEWNNNAQGVKRDGIRYGTDIAWKTKDFLEYMRYVMPYTEVSDPIDFNTDDENHLAKAKLGDVIVYDWEGNGTIDHAVVITGFSPTNQQYPLVSGWSEDESNANKYDQRGWTYSEKGHVFIQLEKDENGNYPYHNIRAWLIHVRTEEDMSFD